MFYIRQIVYKTEVLIEEISFQYWRTKLDDNLLCESRQQVPFTCLNFGLKFAKKKTELFSLYQKFKK